MGKTADSPVGSGTGVPTVAATPIAALRVALPIAAFISGWSALVYEVMWQRSLGLVLGATAHASAVVLVGFFGGMAAGSYVLGRLADRVRLPLRAFACVEVGIGLAGAGFALAWPHLPEAVSSFAGAGGWGLFGKALVGIGAVLPAAFLMGGTVPLLVRSARCGESEFGAVSGLLYGVNTIGACLGVAVGGLVLPTALGITGTQWAAVAGNALVALIAFALGGGTVDSVSDADAPTEPSLLSRPVALTIAGVSGFCLLSLEVLWTRMFAQVLHNSVYSFTITLVIFLAALGMGAVATNAVVKRLRAPAHVAPLLMAASGALVLLGGLAFLTWTGFAYFATGATWSAYVLRIALLALVTMAPMAFAGGMVLPLMWRLYRPSRGGAGSRVGIPTLVNTLASAAGALLAGFVVMPTVGLWRGITLVAIVYVVAAGAVAWSLGRRTRQEKGLLKLANAVGYGAVILAVVWVDPTTLGPKGTVLFRHEGSSGVVTVVESAGDRQLKVDQFYTLGGTSSVGHERLQGHLPLTLHPSPRRACFIGVATGITMGAALEHPCDEIVGLEIVPEVLDAVRHFMRWNRRLPADRRVELIAEDGRVYLAATDPWGPITNLSMLSVPELCAFFALTRSDCGMSLRL